MAGITERLERIRRLDGDVRRADPPVPRSAKIELTARCELACYFCAATRRSRARGAMSRNLFERLARELREAGVEHLGVFYLGESFECDWLADAIRYAKKACGFPLVFLTTNGLRATPDRVRACIEAGLDSLKFSINAATPAQFHRVTGASPQVFERVVANVRAARMVRDEIVAAGGPRCDLYASSLRLSDFGEPVASAVADVIGAAVDERYDLPLFGSNEKIEDPATRAQTGHCGGARKPVPCWSLFTEAHVTWDARLSACCLDPSDRFDMGDLGRMSFREAWSGAKFRRLRAAHLAGTVAGTACGDCIGYDDRPRAPAGQRILRARAD